MRRWRVALVGLVLMASLAACAARDREAAEAAYLRYHEAVRAKDLAGVRAGLTEEAARELEGPEAEARLALIQQVAPAEVRVTKATVEGDRATLEVDSPQEDLVAVGKVKMAREGGTWKVASEDWTVTALAPEPDVVPFLAGAGAPGAGARLEGHQDDVTALAFSPEGDRLVSASSGDSTVRLWSVPDGKALGSVTHPVRLTSLAMARDGTVLVAGVGGSVTAWPLTPDGFGPPREVLGAAGEEIALSRNGRLLAATSFQKPVVVHELPSGRVVATLEGSEPMRVVAFSRDGRRLAAAGQGNRVLLWDTDSWKDRSFTLGKVQEGMDAGGLDFSPDGKLLAVAHMDSSVVVLDVDSGEELYNTFVKDASGFDARFSPDGALLATAHQDGTVRLWDPRQAKGVHSLKGHREAAAALAFSPDGSMLASGGNDRTIVLWTAGAPAATPPPAPQATATAPALPPAPPVAGARNLLRNPDGSQGGSHWKAEGEAVVEPTADGGHCFAVRHGGFFWQDAVLPPGTGGYAALVGRLSAERIGPDITGLPYLYGYMMSAAEEGRILEYLQGDALRLSASEPDRWQAVGEVFPVPEGTGRIRFFLNQALGGSAPTGSAARFEGPGLYLFPTEPEARAFVGRFCGG